MGWKYRKLASTSPSRMPTTNCKMQPMHLVRQSARIKCSHSNLRQSKETMSQQRMSLKGLEDGHASHRTVCPQEVILCKYHVRGCPVGNRRCMYPQNHESDATFNQVLANLNLVLGPEFKKITNCMLLVVSIVHRNACSAIGKVLTNSWTLTNTRLVLSHTFVVDTTNVDVTQFINAIVVKYMLNNVCIVQ
jgi:hypothetical protein